MSTTQVGATTVSLDQFISSAEATSYLSSDLDIGFLVATEQVKHQDSQIRRMLGEMRMSSAAREMIGKRIEELRSAFSAYKNADGTNDDMKKSVGISKLELESLEQLDIEFDYKDQTATATSLGMLESKQTRTGDTQTVIGRAEDLLQPSDIRRKVDPSGLVSIERPIMEPGVTGNTLDKEIKRLESSAQQMDSQREIAMIQLNSLISKRENMVQWLSNMEKKTNDTQAGIIGNLR